jgi:hypothetical protein
MRPPEQTQKAFLKKGAKSVSPGFVYRQDGANELSNESF